MTRSFQNLCSPKTNMQIFLNNLQSSASLKIIEKCKLLEWTVVGMMEDVEDAVAPSGATVLSTLSDQRNGLIASDVVVYALEGDPGAALDALKSIKENGSEDKPVRFIAVSSVLAWAGAEKDTEGLLEENYSERTPVVSFDEIKNTENQLLMDDTSWISMVVLGVGMLYGGKKSCVEGLLEEAWKLNSEALVIPYFGKEDVGSNVVPMIHEKDFVQILMHVAVLEEISTKYMLVLDDGQNTLHDIVLAISTILGNGQVRGPTAEEVEHLMLEMPILTSLQVDVKFNTESLAMKEFDLELKYPLGIVQHVDEVVKEYVQLYSLHPLRIGIAGMPRAGKSTLAKSLAKRYYLPIVDFPALIQQLKDNAEPTETSLMIMAADKYTELRKMVLKQEADWTLIPSTALEQVLTLYLNAPHFLNHGYILDDIPRTVGQASVLVQGKQAPAEEVEEDAEAEAEETDENPFQERIKQWKKDRSTSVAELTHCIYLDADNDILVQRHAVVLGETLTEPAKAAYIKTLDKARVALSSAETGNVVQFFKEHETKNLLDLRDEGPEIVDHTNAIYDYLEGGNGKPFNFHPTKEEVLAIEREEEAQKVL